MQLLGDAGGVAQSMIMIGWALEAFICGNNMPTSMLKHYFRVRNASSKVEDVSATEFLKETKVLKMNATAGLLFNSFIRFIACYKVCSRYDRLQRLFKKTEERVE